VVVSGGGVSGSIGMRGVDGEEKVPTVPLRGQRKKKEEKKRRGGGEERKKKKKKKVDRSERDISVFLLGKRKGEKVREGVGG